jgi:hypothetical protein
MKYNLETELYFLLNRLLQEKQEFNLKTVYIGIINGKAVKFYDKPKANFYYMIDIDIFKKENYVVAFRTMIKKILKEYNKLNLVEGFDLVEELNHLDINQFNKSKNIKKKQ